MRPVIKCKQSKNGSGWYWALLIDGEVYADGEAGSWSEGRGKAQAARREWEQKNAEHTTEQQS